MIVPELALVNTGMAATVDEAEPVINPVAATVEEAGVDVGVGAVYPECAVAV